MIRAVDHHIPSFSVLFSSFGFWATPAHLNAYFWIYVQERLLTLCSVINPGSALGTLIFPNRLEDV